MSMLLVRQREPLFIGQLLMETETIAHMLLEAGAYPTPVDYFDRTPASWANQSEHYEIADILNNAANNEKVAANNNQ